MYAGELDLYSQIFVVSVCVGHATNATVHTSKFIRSDIVGR